MTLMYKPPNFENSIMHTQENITEKATVT